MRSLAVKLLLAFLAVVLVGVGTVAVLASRATTSEFQSYVEQGGRMYAERVVDSLDDYYRAHPDWGGVQVLLEGLRRGGGDRLVLADAHGTVVADTQGELAGQPARDLGLGAGTPIVVDGKAAGTLYVPAFQSGGRGPMWGRRQGAGGPATPPGQTASSPLRPSPEEEFLRQVTHGLWVGAGVAGVAALGLGLLLTRQIVAPVRALTAGARRIATGDLSQRVSVSTRDEIGELAGAFNAMAESLSRQEQLRQNLIADVAHELNTPLTVIEGTADGILDGVFEPSLEQVRVIKEEAGLLARIVEDLRDLSLAEAGQLRLERVPTDLAALAQEAVNRAIVASREKGLSLALEAEVDLPPVLADPARLAQILGNLLGNAVRHTGPGGRITLRVERQRDAIHLAVVDTGEGIPAADLPHVFDRFYRADKSRSRRTGGSGLGLAIVRQLVEMHGGRVWVESTRGQGSTFHLLLPADGSPLSSLSSDKA